MIGGYGLAFRQKVKLWRDTESAKLRTMTFGGKVGYIFTYYWKWMLLVLVALMFCGYVGDTVVQAHKETVLEGFFTNDDYNLFPAGELERDFAATLGSPRRRTDRLHRKSARKPARSSQKMLWSHAGCPWRIWSRC